jgi:hypothetical protein
MGHDCVLVDQPGPHGRPGDGMVRIVVTPSWAKLIDFETTLPSAVEELLRQREERQHG